VEKGGITPDDAEAKASELGIGPLASVPAPEAFDPMRLDLWTPCMALAWILWRSADKVREYWKEYREECSHWVFQRHRLGIDGDIREGHFLEQREAPTIARLPLGVSWDELNGDDAQPSTHLKSFEDARAELWAMLTRGSLRASGVNRKTRERTEIPASLWPDLDAIEEHGHDVFRPMKQFPHGLVFEDVRLDAGSVTDLWLPALDEADRAPLLVTPDTGYIPLSAAAHWVATEGGTIDAPNEALREGYRLIVQAVVDGRIEAIGTSDGLPAPIPGHVFASCRVRHPFDPLDDDVVLSETVALICYAYVDDALWQSGFDDSLRNWNGPRWRRISVKSADICAVFRYAAAKQSAYENPTRTGAPGRPGSKHLLLLEFEARAARHEVCERIGMEAKALAAWLPLAHPNVKRMAVRAVENDIREAFHEFRRKSGLPPR